MAKTDDVYVFSTLTAANIYRKYVAGGADLPTTEREVRIEGGTNVPNKHLITKHGVMTTVSAEDFSWLQDDEVFKLHQKNGFITVQEKPADAEVVAADMTGRDQSAPLVEHDFKEDQKPKVSGDEDDTPKIPAKPNSRRA